MAENEMVGWHHRLNGHEFEQTPGNSEGRGTLALEEEMAIHSGILAWKILWTEEPGGLQSMQLQRARHNLASKQQQKYPE